MHRWLFCLVAVAALAPGASAAAEPAPPLDGARLEALTGARGQLDATSGVFKVSVPRADLSVATAGVRMTPALGLTSWAAFQRADDHVMVMGDLVLAEDQVDPVMSAALDGGLEVTALHNHFLFDSPKVMFMHVSGMGGEEQLGAAVGKVFAKIRDTSGSRGSTPLAGVDPASTSLDPKKIDAALGMSGTLKDGVYKVVVGRTVTMNGHEVGAAMGVNSWAGFAGSNERAVMDGDLAVLESELQPVLKALRARGVSVVAIHQHMTGEEPRMLFVHFWGVGATEPLARALRGALDVSKAGAR